MRIEKQIEKKKENVLYDFYKKKEIEITSNDK